MPTDGTEAAHLITERRLRCVAVFEAALRQENRLNVRKAYAVLGSKPMSVWVISGHYTLDCCPLYPRWSQLVDAIPRNAYQTLA